MASSFASVYYDLLHSINSSSLPFVRISTSSRGHFISVQVNLTELYSKGIDWVSMYTIYLYRLQIDSPLIQTAAGENWELVSFLKNDFRAPFQKWLSLWECMPWAALSWQLIRTVIVIFKISSLIQPTSKRPLWNQGPIT